MPAQLKRRQDRKGDCRELADQVCVSAKTMGLCYPNLPDFVISPLARRRDFERVLQKDRGLSRQERAQAPREKPARTPVTHFRGLSQKFGASETEDKRLKYRFSLAGGERAAVTLNRLSPLPQGKT